MRRVGESERRNRQDALQKPDYLSFEKFSFFIDDRSCINLASFRRVNGIGRPASVLSGVFSLIPLHCCLHCGVLLLLVAVDGRGSSGGSAFLFGLGLFFLILSQFIFNVGLINWRFANPCPENAEG